MNTEPVNTEPVNTEPANAEPVNAESAKVEPANTEPAKAVPIAIIGMACMFPQAPNLGAFWQNIVRGIDAITEPEQAWDAQRYLDSGRIHTAAGGYLKDLYRFDPTQFGIMPSSLAGGEPDQFLALRIAADALADGGYLTPHPSHRDTGIVLGHSTYLHRGQGTLIQNHIVLDQTIELLDALFPELEPAVLEEIRHELGKTLPASTVDIAPALVPNVMTGRIANRLDLKGPNYLIDAACSSSLLAVSAAIDELRAGRCKMMLAGGVNATLPAEVNVIFTQLGALSHRGKVRPFEEGSDGTLLGEGVGVVLLKRLSDARNDGDRIYCVLHAVGQASDGKGQGLLAPSVEGESLAMERAYRQSGIDPGTVSNVEAHGSGIVLGDQTEIAAMLKVFSGPGPREPLAIGSIKSMISHCIPAAGIAGLIKTSLALHHRILPPTLCEKVNPALGIRAPLYVNQRARPWIAPEGRPRRAGVNSFGFGGINTHAILEQAPTLLRRPPNRQPRSAELCVLSAFSRQELQTKVRRLSRQIEAHPEWSVAEIAAALARDDQQGSHRLAWVAKSRDSLSSGLKQAEQRLSSGGGVDVARTNSNRKSKSVAPEGEARFATRGGCFYSEAPLGGKLAFLFPGEGSQYVNMLSELCTSFSEVQGWFDFWAGLYGEPPGSRRTDIVFPLDDHFPVDDRTTNPRLFSMDVGSEAAFIGDQAMYALLSALGIVPDLVLGHSSGESAALAAAGVLGGKGRDDLGEAIRRLNEVYREVLRNGDIPTGALLAVGALPAAQILDLARAISGQVAVAMDNCENQLVLYCPVEASSAIENALGEAGAICLRLPFDRGVHTPAFEAGRRAFFEYYAALGLSTPRLPLYSCVTCAPFPDDPQGVCALAAQQWSTTVRFRETIEALHDQGVRAFVEVGPSGNLTSFVHDVLKGRQYLAVASNLRQKGDLEQLLCAMGQLYVDQRKCNIGSLFLDRDIAPIEWEAPALDRQPGLKLDNTLPRIRLNEQLRKRLSSLTRLQKVAAPSATPDPAQPKSAPRSTERFATASTTSAASPSLASDFSKGFLSPPHVWTQERLVAACPLDVRKQQFLRDHVLSGPVSHDRDLLGLSCVPLMVSLEILAQASCLLAGHRGLRVISDITAVSWIALDELQTTLEAEVLRVDGSEALYAAELRGPDGPILRARYQFSPGPTHLEPLAPLDEHRPSVYNGDQLYSTGMFHGPTFQSIRHIYGWNDAGIDAQLCDCSLQGFFRPNELAWFVTNPILLDAAGQLAAFWICQQVGTDFNCFPTTIERIEWDEQERADAPPQFLLARQRPQDPRKTNIEAARTWDFEYRSETGKPLLRVHGLSNVYFPVPHAFYELRRDPIRGFLGHFRSDDTGNTEGSLTWELPLLSTTFLAQSHAIFSRILAACILDRVERDEWLAFSGSPSEKRSWLMEKLCLKEAVRAWVFRETGQLLYATDIRVCLDQAGNPSVLGWWTTELIAAPRLVFTRAKEAYIATVFDASAPQRLERVERPREGKNIQGAVISRGAV